MEMLIINIGQLVTPQGTSPPSGERMNELYVLEDTYVKILGGEIVAIGPMRKLSSKWGDQVLDAEGAVILPGLVDPHTHAVFTGTREEEFLKRCQGERYGKGLLNTVERVRAASAEELYHKAKRFLLEMLRRGTTTAEVKSGYGLDLKGELKILKTIRKLNEDLPIDLVPTFLGAHAVPQDKTREDYIAEVITMISQVAEQKLAEFCDVFCEEGFFSVEESRKILKAAKSAGLLIKIHADELSPAGGAELAAELGAVSADHLLKVSSQGIKKLKEAGVIAVLLPGTAFSLNEEYAKAREMIDAGLPVALGTDFNPGTCLINSMFLIMALAIMKMKMTIEEAIVAGTLNAAYAVSRGDKVGSIELGKKGDLLILQLENYRQIPYFFGHNFIKYVIKNGRIVFEAKGLC